MALVTKSQPQTSATEVTRPLPPAHVMALPRPTPGTKVRGVGDAFLVTGVLVLSVVFYVLIISPLAHQRSQHVSYNELRYQIANGIAPVGQVTMSDTPVSPGTPLGTITIDKLGVNEVFVSGTSSSQLQTGPGHRPDSVLPGQSGASVIMGKQFTFGGPFRHLDQLQPGDKVTTLTGQGEATYVVSAIRRTGDPLPDVLDAGAGRLTLVSATGFPFLPQDVIRVDLELVSQPFVTPNSVISPIEIGSSQAAFSSDATAWPWIVIWLAAWFVVWFLIRALRSWWGTRQAWIVGVPLFALVTSLLGGAVMQVVPNLI